LAERGTRLGDISQSLLGHADPAVDERRQPRDCVCRVCGGIEATDWSGRHHGPAQGEVLIIAGKF